MVIFSVIGFCRWGKGFYCFSGKLDFGRLFLREMGFGVDNVGSGEVGMVLLRSGGSELPGQSGWSATSLLPLWS